MARGLRIGLWITAVGVAAIAAGLAVLLLDAFSEVLAHPGISLVDGYQIGRLPWTAIGVDLVVLGSTVAVLGGTAASWLAGGALRRLISVVPLAVAGFWVFLAVIESGTEGAFCATCAQPGFDPTTVAYSAPEQATLLLILPAAISALIAAEAIRGRN